MQARFVASVLALPLALLASSARAQQSLPAANLERLEMDPAALGSIVLGTGETIADSSFRLSLAAHVEHEPVQLRINGTPVADVVNNRWTGHLNFAYGISKRFELSVAASVMLQQSGDDLSQYGYSQPASSGIGEPIFGLRVGLLREADSAPLNLALHAAVGIPLGGGKALVADDSPSISPRLLISKHLASAVLASLEAGVTLRNSAQLNQQTVGNQASGGAALAFIGERWRGELTLRALAPFTGTPSALELLPGLRFKAVPSVELFAVGGPGFVHAPGTPQWRFLIGIAWQPVKEAAPPPPPPPPAEPKVEKVVEAPPPPNPCAPGQPHTPQQCPDLDDDGDGLSNAVDACPLEPGPIDNKGCPAKDTDGDGVPDYLDNCPTIPGPASNSGCPLAQKQIVSITKEKLVIKETVLFETNKAKILPRSFALLKQVAAVLQAHQEIPAVAVEGHTDSVGSAEKNLKLSQARAESVRAFLIKLGVAGSRLQAKGYGLTKPIDTNDTPAGRANNRRVEFTFSTPETTHELPAKPVQTEVKP